MMLSSLPLYDKIRRTTNVTRFEGTNIDRLLELDSGSSEEIALCHISSIIAFTYGDFEPQENGFEDAASIALAAQHLNTGDGTIVPQLAGLHERCPIRFTAEFADTEFRGGVALNHVVKQTSRTTERLPCAFIGAGRSSVSIPTSIVTGVLGYPQVSATATSADLDDASQYPLFGRTVPSDAGTTIPIVIYIRKVLNVRHLAVINVNDAYGNAYVEGLRRAAEVHAPDMRIHQIPLDEGRGSIVSTISNLKATQYRYIFCVVFSRETHDQLLTEAYKEGVAGTGKHNWLFGDSFLGTLDDRRFEEGSPLHLAYRGSALLEVSGGVPGIPKFDKFASEMARLRDNPEDMQYLGSIFPRHDDQPAYLAGRPQGVQPFVNNTNFLISVKSNFAPFQYEAAVALGLSACAAFESKEGGLFSGQEHFDKLRSTTFDGISGPVNFDKTTGTREVSSALYKVANYVERKLENDQGIAYDPVVTSLFREGEWNQREKFIFNDGTTSIPPDLPPQAQMDSSDSSLMVFVFVPLATLLLLAAVAIWYYGKRQKNSDTMWSVKQEELCFGSSPTVIGRGTFGVVLLAEYRGTQVAVKRVLPKKRSADGYSRRASGTNNHSSVLDSHMSWAMMTSTKQRNIHSTTLALSRFHDTRNGTKKKDNDALLRKMRQDFVAEMRCLSKLRHPCITTVMGAVTGKDPMLVMEYMEHGSLHDLLHNETMVIDSDLLLPILRDISQGVRFLHAASPPVIHGDLKALNVLVDHKFRAKVADFGLSQKRNLGGTGTPLWMAPELLRGESSNTAQSDVYSFGIILYEVYSRRDPYEGEDSKAILRQIAEEGKRPPFPHNMCDKVKSLMSDCVEDDPSKRPSFEELDTRLKRIDIESLCSSKKAKPALSLLDIFPRHVANALHAGQRVEPEHRDCVTVFFSDIVDYTKISAQMEPQKVADLLDRLYTRLDELSRKHNIFKVETVGDAYMAVANLEEDQSMDHTKRIAMFALEAVAAASETMIDVEDPSKGCISIRVGFHSGPVVADVVGTRNPRYCLFGDTVNTASRMESHSEPNRIHCSEASAIILSEQFPDFPLSRRGRIEIKGKSKMVTYWVNEGTKQIFNKSSSIRRLSYEPNAVDARADDLQLEMESGVETTHVPHKVPQEKRTEKGARKKLELRFL